MTLDNNSVCDLAEANGDLSKPTQTDDELLFCGYGTFSTTCEEAWDVRQSTQLVHQTSQTPDIAFVIVLAFLQDLWGHIERGL
jgi:hypothetical protein